MTDAREAEQVLVARHWTRCVRVAHPIILFGGYEDRLRRFLPVVHRTLARSNPRRVQLFATRLFHVRR